MSQHFDVIVIGAGLSGLMAARAAVELGKKTLIVGKGTGSLCLFSNTIDVLGNLSIGMKLADGLRLWIKDHPEHPYSKLDWEKIEQALSSFRSLFGSQYPFQSVYHENCLILTGAGTYRPTYLVPPTMRAAAPFKDEKVLFVGFKGFKDFYADYVADQLRCRAIVMPLSEYEGGGRSAAAIARLMEKESFREALGKEVKKRVKDESSIGFPAVLGMRDPSSVKKHLEEIIGAEVFEIPTLPPSIPGMRIFRSFKEWLIQRGANFLLGHSVFKTNFKLKRCVSIEVSHSPLSQSYSADRFILATGRFIGEGLRADEEKVFEPLFNLPLIQPGSRDDWFGKSFFGRHPIHRAGILTDSSFQPLDQNGEPVFDNVWVAGSILAGQDCIEEKSREGIEIATGYWAAQNAFRI